MALIAPKSVQEILSIAKVEDVIDEFVNLRRRGANLLGLCPFHNEKTPSFTVSPAKNLYKCFGCGKAGGPVTFLMDHDSLSYPEALRYLAKKYNIKIDEVEQNSEELQKEQERQSHLLINAFAQQYYTKQLLDTDEGRAIGLSYLKHRGFIESTIEIFGLGYSPKEKTAFKDFAIQSGYSEEALRTLGLISQSGYDFYRERVTFPFHNISGKVIGFGARLLNENPKAPKYLNSPESDIYNKRKTLYGLYQAKNEIRRLDYCILVEGYTDVISLYQNGIKNVVASSGTSLTTEQVRLIKRFTEHVTVLYDGDQAGQNAALRGLDIFLEYDVNVKIATLPTGHDPDSYVRELGYERFTEYIKNESHDFILRLAQNIQNEYQNDPINKSIHIRDLVESIAKIRDHIKRALYIQQCSALLDIGENSMVRETNKAISSQIKKRQKEQRRQEIIAPKQQDAGEYYNKDIPVDHTQDIHLIKDHEKYQERDIIRILVNAGSKLYNPEEDVTIAMYIMQNLKGFEESFQNTLYKKILLECQNRIINEEDISEEFFVHHFDEQIKDLSINLLTNPYQYAKWSERGIELQTQRPFEENYRIDSYQALLRFKFKHIIRQISELEAMFQDRDDTKTTILLTAYQKLLTDRKNISEELGTVVIGR